jgi:hypothetical protein
MLEGHKIMVDISTSLALGHLIELAFSATRMSILLQAFFLKKRKPPLDHPK